MHDGSGHACQGLEGTRDQVRPGLGQNLDGHLRRNAALFDQPPGEVEIGLGGGGKADLDLGQADGHQQIEETELLFHRHGPLQGLIAIAQVHACEQWGPRDAPVRPSPVGLGDHRCGRVLAMVERSVGHVSILGYWGTGRSYCPTT